MLWGRLENPLGTKYFFLRHLMTSLHIEIQSSILIGYVASREAVAKRKPAPKPKEGEEGVEKAEPKTLAEQVKTTLAESLQLVQKARTSAITL